MLDKIFFLAWKYLVHGGHRGVEGGLVRHCVLPERAGGELAALRDDHGCPRGQGGQQTCRARSLDPENLAI